MRRTNTFKLKPTKKQEQKLFELANNCARLWNEINYKHRQSFFNGHFDWNTDEEYDEEFSTFYHILSFRKISIL